MKLHYVLAVGALACGLATVPAIAQEKTDKGAGRDMKEAGHDTKEAGKDVGRAAKKGGRKVKRGSKKVVNKAAEGTEKGAGKVRDKTNP